MENINLMLENAEEELKLKEQLLNVKHKHLESRYFSIIYEMSGEKNGKLQSYILKISTTGRSCENEYKQYMYLIDKKINCITPILYSTKYNYLITKKEKLVDSISVLKSKKNKEYCLSYFFKLGKFFKEIDDKTGEFSTFKKDDYDAYIIPRLMESKFFSRKEKMIMKEKTEQLSFRFNNSAIRNCFASDFFLGNIHLNDNGEFVLLDMGDAKNRNIYENIVCIYLSIKYGNLNQYLENRKQTALYFNEFIKAYGLSTLNEIEFVLFKIKQLILMINFVGGQKTKSSNVIKRLLSIISNKYLILRYKKYAFNSIAQIRLNESIKSSELGAI